MKNRIALILFLAISQTLSANEIGIPVTDYTGNAKLAGKQAVIRVSLNNSKSGEIAVARYLSDNGYKVVGSGHADQDLQISGTIEIVTSNKTKIRDDITKFLEFDAQPSKERTDLLNKTDAVAPADKTVISKNTKEIEASATNGAAYGDAINLDLANRNLNYEKKLQNIRLVPTPEKLSEEICSTSTAMKQTVTLHIKVIANNKETKGTVKSEVKSCALLIDLLTISAFQTALSEITGQ